jgi:hypothetical protein
VILAALALATAPACPPGWVAIDPITCAATPDAAPETLVLPASNLVEVPPEAWAKYERCFKRMRWMRRSGQAVDGMVSAAAVATGAATELNPLLSWGGAPLIIGAKLVGNLFIEGQMKKLVVKGEYKQACRLEKIGFVMSFGWLGLAF